MATNYVNDGLVLDYTAGGAIASGDVVAVGNLVGVAQVDIANGDTGAVAIVGRYTVPKTTGTAWVQGEQLTFDISSGEFSTPAGLTEATGDVLLSAIAAAAAGSADTTGDVLLNIGGSALQI